MKKLLSFLLAALMLCSLLAGCAQDPAPSAEPDPAPATDTQTPVGDSTNEPADESTESVLGVDRDKQNAIEATEVGSTIYDDESIHQLWFNSSPYNFAKVVDNYPADTEYPLVDELTTLSIWFGWSAYQSSNGALDTPNDSPAFQAAIEKTNVTIDWTLANDVATQFPLLLASEDYTDMFINGESVAAQLSSYYADEMILDLTDLIPQYAPNYHALRMDDFNFARCSATDEGKLLGMYTVHPVASVTWWAPIGKVNWLNGADPKTYDQWHDVLVSFRDDYNCPRPLVLDVTGQDANLMAGFGIGPDWIVVDGDVRHSITEEGYREYLTMMHQWYDEGLINAAFYEDSGLTFDFARCASDEVGIFTSGYQWMQLYESFSDDPDFRLQGMYVPVKEEGDERNIKLSSTRDRILTREVIALFNGCSNPELAVAFIDFWFTPEGGCLKGYGVEGQGYYIDEDGIPMLTDLILNPTDPSMTSNNWRNQFIADYIPGLMDWTRDMKGGMSESALEATMKWDYNWVDKITFPSVTRTQEEAEEYSFIMSDVDTRIDETIVKFITGEKSMDEWDSFVDELRVMGLDDARDIQQAAYNRFMAR